MKKYIIILFCFLAALNSCTKDEDKWSDVMKDSDVGSATPYVYFSSPKIFDIANLEATQISFKLNVDATGKAKDFNKLILMKSFNGGDFIQHAEYLPSQLPAEVNISVEDALLGIDGVTKADLKGGDYFDWQFIMDTPDTVVYSPELAATFPDFRSYFASAPTGFTIEGSYTMNILIDDIETADPQKEGYVISLVPGTGKSQYILQDISGTALANLWDVEVAYRLFYIGNNKFVLNSGSEGYPTQIRLTGTVERDGATGVITVVAEYANSCCGLNGVRISFTLTPE
ncbi:MAG: hypothetical protein H6540_00410 [Bacteroidales bacterium]|nr:hypothetical protein [Bacteroidales bacterium]MCB9013917.1 hypothetical protein [Bacteroidales bacterium]